MSEMGAKPRRADAARNIDKIIVAARECFRRDGPDVSLHVIAREAGVGPATLFRNFADKEQLVLAALSQRLSVKVAPVAAAALRADDAAQGLLSVTAALLEVASEELNLLAAATSRQRLLVGATFPLLESLRTLLARGQEQGAIRADLSPNDVVPLLAMTVGALETNVRGSDSWRRYLLILADGILTPAAARPLPEADPVPGVGHRSPRRPRPAHPLG
ncbi:TetR/AcrR family transcriptional regulator [Paenarthrobacter sp. Z7-10]|uniref:TetR/AcrR family transcriptional regulator n=1 Tax=Paenarthrobacter sp. Z7-10 TaxID=2787635 RepID=UPI0022A958A0|nr:TetR/AcrR family transcriptional regulator [Paenarthrobacter sp. Z7-10]MCZ2403365.1 TetR/AcrR family transcriptional regulator [Paenarthrobacter sp. Z7-10]